MNSEPKLVKDIFLAAAELPDQTAQIAYLDQACGEDSGLRAWVNALLRSHDPACSFQGTPAAALTDLDGIWVSEVAQLPLALAVTELARVTHLCQAHKQVTTDPIKSGNEPQVATAYTWHGWPADAPKPPIAPFDASREKQLQEAWAKHLGVPVKYTTSLGTKFMRIPPGEFTMGSTAEEIEALLKEAGEDKHWQDRIKSESLQHKLILTQPIYLGVNDVTQSKYEKLVRTNPSDFSPVGMNKEAVAGMETNRLLQGICLDLDTGRELRSFRI